MHSQTPLATSDPRTIPVNTEDPGPGHKSPLTRIAGILGIFAILTIVGLVGGAFLEDQHPGSNQAKFTSSVTQPAPNACGFLELHPGSCI